MRLLDCEGHTSWVTAAVTRSSFPLAWPKVVNATEPPSLRSLGMILRFTSFNIGRLLPLHPPLSRSIQANGALCLMILWLPWRCHIWTSDHTVYAEVALLGGSLNITALTRFCCRDVGQHPKPRVFTWMRVCPCWLKWFFPLPIPPWLLFSMSFSNTVPVSPSPHLSLLSQKGQGAVERKLPKDLWRDLRISVLDARRASQEEKVSGLPRPGGNVWFGSFSLESLLWVALGLAWQLFHSFPISYLSVCLRYPFYLTNLLRSGY